MEVRQRRLFTEKYKRQAAKLLVSSGRSIRTVGKELGLRVRCCGAALRSSGRSRHRPRGATARRRRRCRRTRLPRSPVCRGERADAHRAGHSKKSIAIFAGTRTRASASSRTIAIPARRLMCAAVEVSRAGYYAWRERPDRARTTTNAALLTDIRVHQDSGARGRQPTGPCRAAGTGTWRHLSTAANFP